QDVVDPECFPYASVAACAADEPDPEECEFVLEFFCDEGELDATCWECILDDESCAAWSASCAEEERTFGAPACEGGGEPSDPDAWQNTCSWDALWLDARDPARPLGDACRVGEEVWLSDGCFEAATILRDVRLDEASMSGLVVNGVELLDSRLRSADLRRAAFFDATTRGLDLSPIDIRAGGGATDLSEADLAGLDLSGTDLRRVKFDRANMPVVSLVGADLEGATFYETNLRDAFLGEASGFDGCPAVEREDIAFVSTNLTGAFVQCARWPAATFSLADLTQVRFVGLVDLTGASFTGALLRNVEMPDGVGLNEASFLETVVQGGALRGDFEGASFDRTRFTGTRLIGNYRDAAFWDPEFDDVDASEADFTGAAFFGTVDAMRWRAPGLEMHRGPFIVDLRQSDLTGARFERLEIRGSIVDGTLDGAALDDADLVDVELRGTSLRGATLRGATVGRRTLTGATLIEADLRGVIGLAEADLFGAELTDALICEADREAVEAAGARGAARFEPCD
ncbi:MAG: pentapeptide repeat-containing protein, partial [Myxococcales bacterium]|nr:pentapeptide repeat-containing protein [Myxococcales bacterium]